MTKKLHYLCTLLLCMIASVGWGQNTSTLMFKDKCNGSGTASDGAIWTVTSDATESTYGGDDGIHYGTNNAAVTYLQLTTSDISGTISQVTVKTRDAQANAAVTVKVGGTSFTCNGNTSVTATNTSTEYVFVGSGSGEIVVRVDRGSSMKKALYLKSIKVVYSAGGSSTPTCDTPTFFPAGGAVAAGSTVTISTITDGADIYYTTDGSTPSASNGTKGTSVTVNQDMTIKAIAVKNGANDSEVAEASYTIKQAVNGYNIDFESDLDCYVDWNFDNVGIHKTGVTSAHGGSAWGSNVNSSDNGTATAIIKTKEKVAFPDVFTCYVSKESSNDKESSWKIQVSSDGSVWNDIATLSSMTQNTWTEFTGDIKASGYTNVYVRLYYEGSTAKRAVDDISLTTYTPVAVEAPSITVPNEFTFSTSATISCITDDATIYYSFDNINWTEYTGVLNITSTTTIYAKAVKGNDESAVAQKTTTKILETPIVTISSTSINVGETATVSANGLDVSLTTSDAAIASVEGATVTGVAAGTATITATWDATSDYSGGTKDFVVTVSDPNGPGSASKPYTVTQALEAPAATGKYVTGKVSQIDEVSTQYGNATYWISTDGTTESDQLKIYRGKYLEEASFTSEDQLQVGDVVVVYGELKPYSGANQMAQGNYLISLKRKAIPTLTFEEEAFSVVKNGELKIIATSSNSTGAITYQSSNTDVAEIDAATGVVTAKAAGTTTITATIAATEEYNTTTATVELTVTAPKHKVTFYQDGTKLSEEEFTEDTPITFPDAEPIINGKTFVGWIAEPINGTIENAPTTLVTSASMGESDAKYYAVYATKVGGEGGLTIVTDVLTRETTGIVDGSTTYADWTGKTVESSAVYAGQSAGGNDAIQLRSDKSSAGVVTTTSGGKATKVTVTWNSNTANGRTLNVYGSNTAYTAATDLYGENAGTLLGTIVNGTSTELTINENYEYVGLRSASGALYLDNITITWESGTPASYSDYCTTVVAPVKPAKPIVFHDSGTYEGTLSIPMFAQEGATIKYTVNGGDEQTYSTPVELSTGETTITAWAVKDGVASDVTEPKTFTIKEKAKGPSVTEKYYTISNNDKYVNVAGRRTVTFVGESATTTAAGTVIKVKATDGEVEVLRSQAVDIPGYAQRAMVYVPKVVRLVAEKLGAEGEGNLLGKDGLDAIMKKFNESFDYTLHLESAGENAYRIYGRTPSMKPVVDFYAENKANVDAKLPQLEQFINSAIEKILTKTGGRGTSILRPDPDQPAFSLVTVWEKMVVKTPNLTKPEDEASTAKFYEELLSSETNVWNFAYETAMIYWSRLKNNETFLSKKESLGEYAKYIDKIEYIRPNVKYYLVLNKGGLDVFSQDNPLLEGTSEWTLDERTEFKVTVPADNELNGKFYTTFYADFAYTVPDGLKAYTIKEVKEGYCYDYAVKKEISGVIPAQTPVLLEADAAGEQTLTLKPEDTSAAIENELKGPDYLIEAGQIKAAQVENLFDMALGILGQEGYDNYLKEYEYLMLRTSGTVNNKYFFGLSKDDCKDVEENVCVLDGTSFNTGWKSSTGALYENKAFLVHESQTMIQLSMAGDVNRDGNVDNEDVNALVNIILGKVTEDDNYDMKAADVNCDGKTTIADVTALVNIILGGSQN